MAWFDNVVREPIFIRENIDKVGNWLKANPTIYKGAIVIDHLIRASSMYGLMISLPYRPHTNYILGAASSLFYRTTAEGPCAFRFSLISSFGAASFVFAKSALTNFISGKAFGCLKCLSKNSLEIAPLVIYTVCVLRFANNEVNEYIKKCGSSNPKSGDCCGTKKVND